MKVKVYQGYSDVDLTQAEWAHIYGLAADMVTAYIDYAGGYQFPLDGTFPIERFKALFAIIIANKPTEEELQAFLSVQTGANPAWLLLTKLGFDDPDLKAALETITGIPAEQTIEAVVEGEVPLIGPIEDIPPPPGRGPEWQSPAGELYYAAPPPTPWWHWGLAVGGGAAVGAFLTVGIGALAKK